MSELLKPPAVPSAILDFFSSQPDFAAVMGDMSEEFHQRAQISGAQSAKLWYWREAFRNAMALTAREVLRTPFRTAIVAFGCLLAVNAVTALHIAMGVYLFPFRLFWNPWEALPDQSQMNAFLVVQFAASLALGWIAGRLLPGREWALALMYSLVTACVAGIGFTVAVVFWHLRDSFAEVPEALRVLLIWEFAFRLGAFWLGCLWIRRSRSIHSRANDASQSSS